MADRFTIFRDGQYVDTVNAKEVTESDLVAMMVGRKIEGKSYANLEEKGEEVLTVKGLSKKGNFKDINFTVRKGEVLGVTGLVGAGRSETAQAIFGLTSIDSGQVFIEGKEVHIKSPADALKMGIAYVPESRQTQGLVLPKTIRENILLPQLDKYANKLGILNNKEMEDATNKWIEMLDVRPNNPDLTAMSLSGGNPQKVVLAKWISTQAKVLIVDEPTNGVDIGAKDEIHKILRNLAKEGMAVIVISSELPEILTVSDRIMVMRRGRVSGFLDNKDLTQEMIMKLSVA